MKIHLNKISGLHQLGLIFLFLLLITACSNNGYRALSDSEISENSMPMVFNDSFEKALYQTTINIYKNKLTGITLIKKSDSSYRVVSMSELGVKYFDIEIFSNSQKPPNAHYIMEILNRKMLVKMLLSDFQLLLSTPSNSSMVKNENNNSYKIKDGKIIYHESSVGISKIWKSRFVCLNKLLIQLNRDNPVYPDTIFIDHGKISLELVRIIE